MTINRLKDNGEMCQRRKWFLYQRGQLLQQRVRQVEPEMAYSIGGLKRDNDIFLIVWRSVDKRGAIINSDRNVWPLADKDFFLTRVPYVQRTLRPRRRGDSNMICRHLRQTYTSA